MINVAHGLKGPQTESGEFRQMPFLLKSRCLQQCQSRTQCTFEVLVGRCVDVKLLHGTVQTVDKRCGAGGSQGLREKDAPFFAVNEGLFLTMEVPL